jgi:hypothetical protein
MTEVPLTPHTEIITAGFVVEVVVKATELPVLKAHASEASSAGDRRRHHLDDDSEAPFFVTQMIDFIADA